VIDEAIGESSQLRYHSPLLQDAVDGLFAAIAGWRTVAARLAFLPAAAAQHEAEAVLRTIPEEVRSPSQGEPTLWTANPIVIRRLYSAAIRTLIAMPASTPSLRLLAARVLAGLSHVLDALAFLAAEPPGRHAGRRRIRLYVPDWAPALVNAGRAFVTIGAVEVFWIVTEWPNGALAITFPAIAVILLAPRADAAYAQAVRLTIGTALPLEIA
jgi:Fusaric acid resistance protein family